MGSYEFVDCSRIGDRGGRLLEKHLRELCVLGEPLVLGAVQTFVQ